MTIGGAMEGCPSPGEVAARTAELHPHARAIAIGDLDDALHVELSEKGARYAIAIPNGARRWFDDPARNCAERARVAAVSIALWIDTGELPGSTASLAETVAEPAPADPVDQSPPESPSPSVTLVVSLPKPDHRSKWRATTEAEGALAVGAGGSPGASITTGGAVVRVAVARRLGDFRLGPVADVGLTAPAEIGFATGAATIQRIPIGLGARATWGRGRFEAGLDLALAIESLRIEGRELTSTQQLSTTEVGARLGALAFYWITPWLAPVLRLEGTWLPLAGDVAVSGIGVVGRLPAVWISVDTGLAVSFP